MDVQRTLAYLNVSAKYLPATKAGIVATQTRKNQGIARQRKMAREKRKREQSYRKEGESLRKELSKPLKGTLYTYFWSRIVQHGGCYLWAGPVNSEGYGVVCHGGHTYTAYRLAWKLMGRTDIPDWMELDHLCRRRRCVNVGHLEMVTPSTNSHRVGHRRGVCHAPPCPSPYDLGNTMETARFLALAGVRIERGHLG